MTSANDYMGPAVVERFEAEGAEVIADTRDPTDPDSLAAVASSGRIDVLVVNLLARPNANRASEITDAAWSEMFEAMVAPLMRYVRAVLPTMIGRRSGKIIAHTSAAALSGIPGLAHYTAARSAQNAFLRNVAVEVARHNVQVNGIAQHFTESARGFRDRGEAHERWVAGCPARRTAEGWECAELTVFLASSAADFITGAIVPFDGGWSAASPSTELAD